MKKFCIIVLFLFASLSVSAFTITSVITNVSCNGNNDGSIDINPSGGMAPYTYSWSNGATTQDIDSLVAGTYTVTVTDAAAANQTGVYTIVQNSDLTISGNALPVTCYGGADGSIGFGVSGGSGAYTYSINGSSPVTMQALTENFQWLRQGSSTSTGSVDNKALGIVTDKNGNVFITGEFYGTLTLGTTSLVSAASGTCDLFIAKYSAAGTLIWAQRVGGIGYDSGNGIATDTAGNIFITGRFRNTVTFGSFTLTSSSTDDLFVAKYDTNGNCLWVMHPTGTNNDYGWSLATDDAGNCYMAGSFSGNITIGALPVFTSTSALNILVIKIDPSGTPLWAKRSTSTGTACHGYGIALDKLNNVYVTGFFTNTITFGSFSATSLGSRDVFITKYNNSGTEQWLRSAGGSSDDYGLGICTDNANNVYATGYFRNSMNFGSGVITAAAFADDIFLVKFNSAGTALWSQRAGASSNDRGYAISCDQFNNVYLTGYYFGAATFSTITAATASINAVFVAKYNSAGTIQMVKEAFATGGTEAFGIYCDKKGSIFVSGFLKGTVTFGPLSSSSGGVCDLFASRFSMTSANDTLMNLPAGNYTLSVSDYYQCTSAGSFIITQPAAIAPLFSTTDPLCFGGSGSSALTISGGSPPYSQNWGTADPMALTAGNYNVLVTDSAGCDTLSVVTVTDPPLLNANVINTPELCFGQCNISAYVTATGGTGGYAYLWSTANTNDSISGLCPGNYYVVVSDSNNCKDTTAITFAAATQIQSNPAITNMSCYTICDGAATLSVTGGSPGYTYLWCNGNTSASASGLCEGMCTVTIWDNNGCMITDTISITAPPEIFLTMSAADTICAGSCTTLNATVAGGTPGYNYSWSPGSLLSDSTIYNPVACPLSDIIYTVTISDQNGCPLTGTSNVSVDLCTGISLNSPAEVEIYPNPFHTVLNIYMKDPKNSFVTVYNTLGELVYKEALTGRITLHTESWENGLYLIILEDQVNRTMMKILKN
jgi:hypothetical protein